MYICVGFSFGTDAVGASGATAKLPLLGASSRSGGREYLVLIGSLEIEIFEVEKACE
jgi:hypothetical protein